MHHVDVYIARTPHQFEIFWVFSRQIRRYLWDSGDSHRVHQVASDQRIVRLVSGARFVY